ncbi:MAG: hypothetical protein IIT71_06335 [Acetobacter sp.]|nr:hypothetical protein [Acetobacter sp.]
MTKKVNKNNVEDFRTSEQIDTEFKFHEFCVQQDLFVKELLPESPLLREKTKLYQLNEALKHEARKALKKSGKIKEKTNRKFAMFFEDYALVQDWLFENSKRPPKECARVWANMCLNMIPSTRQVALTREEIAEQTGVNKDDVSKIINELARIRAVFIEYEKQEGVRYKRALYFINPRCCQNGRLRSTEEIENEVTLNLEQATAARKARKEGESLKALTPKNDLNHEVSASMREAVPTEEAKNKPKRGKRGLKVIKGGLILSTMENMSDALAVRLPDPFDEAKKALKDMAVKSYAAVMADPIIARDPLYFLLFLLCSLTWIAMYLSFDVQGISVLRHFGFY